MESSSRSASASLDEEETDELGVDWFPLIPAESPALGFLGFSSMEESTSDDEQDMSKALERVL